MGRNNVEGKMNLLDNILAVTLDVGGTLIEPNPSVGHVYADVVKRHGMYVSPELLNHSFAAAWQTKMNFHHSRSDWSQLVNQSFVNAAHAPLSEAIFDEIYERFASPDVWKIYDDVIPALDALSDRGIRLAVVSNWDERLRLLLPRLKLDRFFETVVVSYEVGFPKPSPVIFEYALRKLGLPAEAVLHVGDSFSEDFLGAQNVGCKAVLLARGEKEGKPNSISSLKQLPGLL
jgi:putative hydrolase of the HAD superfamily